ncbi:MAG TPA: bifunctional diaminohydroxyphosphoribosylaminopyrimidine deaminase/5-amino-6-(5-phosphoribosylamino)uracil reductase RibD [Burkholderiales bacterium]|nr:bifunctional diaminohydroxyphosphoribosylaminopyrimidine deaminase/5-amino-6-(5-phosphoribosylamino)uracil reductase RibD [Burkholderiales bacterium]
MPFSAADHEFMAHALQLAERGLYTTTPNPRVGCVIVSDGAVVGAGWHERAGGPHAEIVALRAAGDAARGATLYVTLEPCHHHGRTPPCDEAVIAAGFRRVVIALRDPDPRTAGQGIARLRQAGIEVESGVLESAARELNIGFVSRLTRGRPWVRVKLAASLDGGTTGGDRRWITGEAARRDGQRWRARACAVLTGSGTVRADDPQLNVRDIETPRQPLRVVVASRLAIPPAARVLEGGALVVCADAAPEKIAALRAGGAEVITLPDARGRVDLTALMAELGRREINELHVEAGATLSGALLQADLVDELLLYFAPCVLGSGARGMFELPDASGVRHDLKMQEIRMVGNDLRMLARLERK